MEVLLGHSFNGYGSGGDDHLPRTCSVYGDPDRIGWQGRDSNGAKDGARHIGCLGAVLAANEPETFAGLWTKSAASLCDYGPLRL